MRDRSIFSSKFRMHNNVHCWNILLILVLGKVASKTQYSHFVICKVWVLGFTHHFTLHPLIWQIFSLIGCIFQQCEYCEVGNVIIEFSTLLMPKKAFQITCLRLVIWKTFSAFVMWKTQYSHILLTVFSHWCIRCEENTVLETTILF